MADAVERKDLNYKRGAIMARLTRMSTFIENFDEQFGNRFELSEGFQKLDLCFVEFDNVQSKIESLESDDYSEQEIKREEFEDNFYKLKSHFLQKISKQSTTSSDIKNEQLAIRKFRTTTQKKCHQWTYFEI